MRIRYYCHFATTLFIFFVGFTTQAQIQWNPYPGNPALTGGAVDPGVLYDSTNHKFDMWFVSVLGGGIWHASSPDGIAWTTDTLAVAPGPPGSYDQYIQSTSALKYDGMYYLYYTSSRTGDTTVIALATSTDGRHWQKSAGSPVLRPGLPGSWESPKVTGAYVFVRNGTFIMLYNGYDVTHEDGGLATSPDGVTWTRSASNPVLPHGGPSSPDAKYLGISGLAEKDSTLYCIYRATSATGALTYCAATSVDGIHWQKDPRNPVYTAPPGGWDSYQIGGGALLCVNGKFMFWWAGTSGGPWGIGLSFPDFSGINAFKPVIDSLTVLPHTNYQIRISWFRSSLDTAGAADQVTQYSIWRLVPGTGSASPGPRPPADIAPSAALISPLWDFIQTVPAAGFAEYSTVIGAYVDYTVPLTENILMVAAHTKNLNVYFSNPDTILVDPPALTGVSGTGATQRVTAYSLEQNYPNPFNPSTSIRYALPRASAARLSVFNTLGQEVAQLVDAFQDAGVHEVRFNAEGLASGVYVYRLSAGGYVQSRRLLLLR